MENDINYTGTTATEVTTQKLFEDLKTVVRDGQELLKAGIGDLSERSQEARVRFMRALENAKESCQTIEKRAVDGVQAADKMVREHPYQSVAIACGLGILVGLLASRGSSTRDRKDQDDMTS